MRSADGQQVCLSLSSAPILDDTGRCIGARAVASDVTVREQRELKASAALRRVDVLDHVLDQMRQEVLAPLIMSSMLATTVRALGAAGAAVINLAEAAEADDRPARGWRAVP